MDLTRLPLSQRFRRTTVYLFLLSHNRYTLTYLILKKSHSQENVIFYKINRKYPRNVIYCASVTYAVYTDTNNSLFIFWTHSNFIMAFLLWHLNFKIGFIIPKIQTEYVALNLPL